MYFFYANSSRNSGKVLGLRDDSFAAGAEALALVTTG